jgi:hypothetical protein
MPQNAAQTRYVPLEPTFANDIGMNNMLNFSTTGAISLFTSISFLWTLGIVACVAGAGFVWVRGGLYRMEASEAGIRKSNEEFKRGSLGLLGVMSLFLILYTVNKGLLIGDVGLNNLMVGGSSAISGGGGTTQQQTPPSTVSVAGANYPWPTGPVSGKGVTCNGGSLKRSFSKSTACMDQYKSIILDNSAKYGVDKDIIRAVIYQESSGNPNVRSPVGALGLMQIMPSTANKIGCLPGWEFDPVKNIDCGTRYLKSSMSTYSSYDIYAGYNGGYGANAMNPSSFCPGLKRWQCAFDSADFSVCNEGFIESRDYAIMTDAWVRQYKGGSCSW